MKYLFIYLFLVLRLQAQDLHYFPLNYADSKEKFLRLASVVPRGEQRQFSMGKDDLTVDVLYIPPKKQKKSLVIITSGNHGPEAYLGSALQQLFLKEILGALDQTDCGFLIVHALNPWGFMHHRRGTENNVNLNRNFSADEKLFAFQNVEYQKVANFLEPRSQAGFKFPAIPLFWKMLIDSKVTQQGLTQAIGQGQYEFPHGINFGGKTWEPQTSWMMGILSQYAKDYRAIFNIDLHTGLGDRGVLHFMTKDSMNDAAKTLLYEILNPTKDREHLQLTLPQAEGFYDIHGDYADILKELIKDPKVMIIPVTAEFGTVGNGLWGKLKTINRLILENQGFYYGYPTSNMENQTKQDFLELFYPSDKAWRSKVLKDGRYLLETVVGRFIEANAI